MLILICRNEFATRSEYPTVLITSRHGERLLCGGTIKGFGIWSDDVFSVLLFFFVCFFVLICVLACFAGLFAGARGVLCCVSECVFGVSSCVFGNVN
jgi:hypothetical protein